MKRHPVPILQRRDKTRSPHLQTLPHKTPTNQRRKTHPSHPKKNQPRRLPGHSRPTGASHHHRPRQRMHGLVPLETLRQPRLQSVPRRLQSRRSHSDAGREDGRGALPILHRDRVEARRRHRSSALRTGDTRPILKTRQTIEKPNSIILFFYKSTNQQEKSSSPTR